MGAKVAGLAFNGTGGGLILSSRTRTMQESCSISQKVGGGCKGENTFSAEGFYWKTKHNIEANDFTENYLSEYNAVQTPKFKLASTLKDHDLGCLQMVHF